MIISEISDPIFDVNFNLSEIIIPFSNVIKKNNKDEKYSNLSEIPNNQHRTRYITILREELV